MAPIAHEELVRQLQERTARALPAQEVEDVGGWSLRYAPGCSWWVGTVQPHGVAGPGELVEAVARAEAFYARRDAVARFQISPGACPAALDGLLAERGYRRHSPMSLQTAPTARALQLTEGGALEADVDDGPTRPWFDVWKAGQRHGDDASGEWHLLARVTMPSAYASVHLDDRVVAVGRAVADTGWAGVFGMATVPDARGRGGGRAVLRALARWAVAHGADDMYLQVEPDNIPAVPLYGRAGFRELCRYHYRVA
jgi:GNAT superfamily N-acetyltransferase